MIVARQVLFSRLAAQLCELQTDNRYRRRETGPVPMSQAQAPG